MLLYGLPGQLSSQAPAASAPPVSPRPYLFLTESGQALSQKYNTDYFSQLLPYLDSISEEDAACTIQTLEKFYAIMRERKDSLEKR